jgi:hypothetical protein
MKKRKELAQIRKILLVFMVALFLSGLTAVPIDPELSLIIHWLPPDSLIHQWMEKVLEAYRSVTNHHPFLLYGYDWLAFAHLVLTILFIGPYRDPVRNIWIIEFGMITCVLVLPLAFIAGYFRQIPIGWQLIDCSFGAVGFIPLWICYRKTKLLILTSNFSTQ